MILFDIKTSFVLTTGILNLLLGLVIYFRNSKDLVSKSFAVMTIFVGLWSFAAFAFRIIPVESYSYLAGYILYVTAAILPQLFFVMTLAFPPISWLNKRILFFVALECLGIVVVTCWPGLVIRSLELRGTEKILLWNPFYLIYALHHFMFFALGYGVLAKKYFLASGVQKKQVLYVILGTILPANLALISNLILPWFGYYSLYTWFGQVCMILIVAFSGYAILKHGLFNIKIIATEILVIASVSTLLIRFFLVRESADRWVSGITFLLVSVFGAWLVKAVWREVEQRELLEGLTNELAIANAKLKTLDQARADFITLTSHQLRTPPATVKWYLAAVQSGDFGPLTPEVKDPITKAEIANNSLISLIDDLLNASRIERGKMEFLFEPISLPELTKFTVEQLQPQASIKGLKLVFRAPVGAVPEVQGDKEKIRQVINNFIDNSIKYTPSGIIEASVVADSEFVTVAVKDTGKGMEEGIAPSLFEKYSRGKDSVMHATGIGIGLYVAKIVIENHNGQIGANSEGVGKGSVFYFKLPIKSSLPRTKMMDLADSA